MPVIDELSAPVMNADPVATVSDRHARAWRNSRLAGRITQLDGLRGIAILIVVAYHYTTAVSTPRHHLWSAITSVTRLFWSGVDLFFVLSGFLIAGILIDSSKSGSYFRTFYLRRIHRIFPLYFGWLLIFYVGISFHLDSRFGVDLFQSGVPLWMYPLFIQNNAPLWLNTQLPLWLAITWSLAVEEQFYLVLPAIIRYVDRVTLFACCAVTVLISPIYRFSLVSTNPGINEGWPFSTLARLDGLAFGVMIAILVRNRACWEWLREHASGVRSATAALGLALIAMTCAAPGPIAMAAWGFTVVDVFYAMLLMLAVLDTNRRLSSTLANPVLIYFGSISYAVYIFHQGVRGIVGATLPALGSNGVRSFLVWTISASVTVLLAHVSWRVLESKLIRRAHKRYKYQPAGIPNGERPFPVRPAVSLEMR